MASTHPIWSLDAAKQHMVRRWGEGASASEIARELSREFSGTVSRNAVIGQIYRLGLPKRAAIVAVVNRRRSAGAPVNSTWNDARLRRLEELAAMGMKATEIARCLGGITPTAIHKMAHRRGIELVRVHVARPKAIAQDEKPKRSFGLAGNGAVFEKASPDQGDNKPWISASRLDERMRAASGEASGGLALMDLGRCQCRWPLGGMFDPPELFCAAETPEGSPYCATHQRVSRVAGSASGPRSTKELIRSLRKVA